jgi:hypothetical protein
MARANQSSQQTWVRQAFFRQEIVLFSSKICGFPPSREILDIGPTGLPAPRSSQLFSDGEKDGIGSSKY